MIEHPSGKICPTWKDRFGPEKDGRHRQQEGDKPKHVDHQGQGHNNSEARGSFR